MTTPAPNSKPAPIAPWGTWPIVRPVGPARVWALAVVYALVLLPLTYRPRHSGNVFSRYMTVEAIVERGELAIERSPLLIPSGSPDLVRFGPHLYSDKPPVLPALAAPVYAGLYVGTGTRFAGRGNQFVVANLVLTWTVVGLASALAVGWTRRLLQAVAIPAWASDLVALLGLGFTTQLLTYAVTFNNHSVAAALVTGALAATVLEPPGPVGRQRRGRFAAGLMAALAFTVDLPVGGLILAGLGVIQAVRVRNVPWAYLLGAAGPLLLHSVLQSRVTGSPWPAEAYPEAFQYPGSYWSTPAGTWHERGPRFWFALELLLGPQGWLTLSPILVLGLVGVARSAANRTDPMRGGAWVVGATVVGLVAFYTWGVRRLDFGGSSFGIRHLLAVTPVVYVFAIAWLARLRRGRILAEAGAVALSVVGLIYGWAGQHDPWNRVETHARANPAVRAFQQVVPFRPSDLKPGARR